MKQPLILLDTNVVLYFLGGRLANPLPKKGRGQKAAMLKGRKIFDLPSATGFKAPKFIYEKTKKYVFLNAPQEILRPY